MDVKLNLKHARNRLQEAKVFLSAFNLRQAKGKKIVKAQLDTAGSLKALVLSVPVEDKGKVKEAFLMYKEKLVEIVSASDCKDLRGPLETARAYLAIIEKYVK